MAMRIDRLMLHAVGPFDHLDIAFPESPDPGKAEVHMFVGPNGSGKSTILYALAQLFGDGPPLEARLRGRGSYAVVGVDESYTAIVPYGAPQPDQLRDMMGQSSRENLEGPISYWFSRPKEPGLDPIRRYRKLISNPQWLTRDPIPQNFRPLFAAFSYAGSRTISRYRLRAIQEPVNSPLEYALSFTQSTDAEQLVQWIANTKTKEALALARNDKELARRRALAIERIEGAIGRIIGQEIRFVLNDEPLEVRILQNGVDVALDVLPDGLKSILSWIADLLMRLDRTPWEGDVDILDRPFFLFLDEIEIHLHPAWQRKVLPTVQSLFPNAQIFLSTHSPFVVGSVSDAWVYPLSVENGKATCREPLPSKAGESYLAILDEVFGIDQEFDDETEGMFKRFYDLKRRRLEGDASVHAELDDIADRLRARSVETRDIVEREMRQLERLLGATA